MLLLSAMDRPESLATPMRRKTPLRQTSLDTGGDRAARPPMSRCEETSRTPDGTSCTRAEGGVVARTAGLFEYRESRVRLGLECAEGRGRHSFDTRGPARLGRAA